MVYGLLQYTRNRAVILWRNEYHTLGSKDFSFHSFNSWCLVGIIILVIQRQIIDLNLFESELRWSQSYYAIRQLMIE